MAVGFHAHADFAIALGAINGGDVGLGEALAPLGIRFDHQLGYHFVDRRAAQPRHDAHVIAFDIKIVIERRWPGFGFATPGFELFGDAPQSHELGFVRIVAQTTVDICFGEMLVQLIVAQVVLDRYGFEPRFRFDQGVVAAGECKIKRQGGRRAAFAERELLNHVFRQHGDFLRRHVDRREALPGDAIHRVVKGNAERGRGDMNADLHLVAGQHRHRKRIVDFCCRGIIDTEGADLCQWQLVGKWHTIQRRKFRALGKIFEQETVEMIVVGRSNAAGIGEHLQRCLFCRRRGGVQRFVLERIFVRLVE